MADDQQQPDDEADGVELHVAVADEEHQQFDRRRPDEQDRAPARADPEAHGGEQPGEAEHRG